MGFWDRIRPPTIKQATETSPVRLQQRLEVALPFTETFSRCLEALLSIPGCSIRQNDVEAQVITAEIQGNWQTFGDRITLHLQRLTDNQTRVDMICQTSFYQRHDYGRNAGHIRAIKQHLYRERETLLRPASQANMSETVLLRAATNTPTATAPDELLRPAEEEPS